MGRVGLKRLIFISSMCVATSLPPYRKATSIIEASDLDPTIVRPAWLNNRDEIVYGTTEKGETFKNASQVVSRKSVADLVVKFATQPGLGNRRSLGVHKV